MNPMRALSIVSLILGLTPAALPQNATPGKKALLVGNQTYRDSPLKNPGNDVRDFSNVLRDMGFKTQVLNDASQQQIAEAVRQFSANLAPGDLAIFFYSGHGFQIDSENFLVPVEFSASNEVQAKGAAVSLSGIKSSLEKTPAAMVLMILDSCRDNPFAPATRGLTRGLIHGMAPMEAGLGSYVAFSASAGKTASDGPAGKHGLFTEQLLEEIRQPLAVSEVFRKVRQDVFKASGGAQLPYMDDQMIADVHLAGSSAPQAARAEPSPADRQIQEAKLLYQTGKCADAIAILEKLVKVDPLNPFSKNALGLAYECRGMHNPAYKSFSAAIDLKPDYAAAYVNRGKVFMAAAEYQLAVQDFDWAIDEEPDNAVFHWRRGDARFALRMYEDAQADFEDAIRLDPSDAHGYYGRGRVRYQLGKFREALADFDQSIARKTDLAAAYTERARTRDRLADSAGAAADRDALKRLQ